MLLIPIRTTTTVVLRVLPLYSKSAPVLQSVYARVAASHRPRVEPAAKLRFIFPLQPPPPLERVSGRAAAAADPALSRSLHCGRGGGGEKVEVFGASAGAAGPAFASAAIVISFTDQSPGLVPCPPSPSRPTRSCSCLYITMCRFPSLPKVANAPLAAARGID